MVNLNIITNQVYNWINESNTDFNLDFGEKKLYLVVEWTDGASLFVENYDRLVRDLILTYCDLDEDTDEVKVIWFNKVFGIGSDWHRIADKMLSDALDSQTADLNKMEKERDI